MTYGSVLSGFAGTLGDAVCGVDWVIAHHRQMRVANISLVGPGSDDHDCGLKHDDPMHYAICQGVAAGITFVAAAGNDSMNVSTEVRAAYSQGSEQLRR
jgi:subtilisin